MVDTLDNVINEAQKKYGLPVTAENRQEYDEFLQRVSVLHPDYFESKEPTTEDKQFKYPRYFGLAVDIVLIFARIIGEMVVKKDGFDEEGTFIDSHEKLPLIRSYGQIDLWPDEDLGLLFSRRDLNRRKNELQGYSEIIDEVLSDPYVVKKIGNGLTYEKNVNIK
ncbi:MAG: hypothetical protein IH934_00680 [Nanoarchaeota archaeon]|nr:hypothetical protein [Nanoarchaeota archaeon]